jgi:hypothetical protein
MKVFFFLYDNTSECHLLLTNTFHKKNKKQILILSFIDVLSIGIVYFVFLLVTLFAMHD